MQISSRKSAHHSASKVSDNEYVPETTAERSLSDLSSVRIIAAVVPPLMASARASALIGTLRTAAESTTDITQALLEDSSYQYAGLITIPLVVPVIFVYLQSVKSERSSTGGEKLNMYLRFLTALETNYPAALVVRQVFDAALDAISTEDSDSRDKENGVHTYTSLSISLLGLHSFV